MTKILVVDDEPFVRNLCIAKIQEAGFEVDSAINGEAAIEKAEKYQPDLILMDILMPKLDGISTMKKIRQTAWGKNIPIVIMTNLDADDKILTELKKDEPAFYMMKVETTLKEVVAKLKAVLKLDQPVAISDNS